MMKTKLIVTVLAVAVLAGCQLNLVADVYSSDLRASLAGETDLSSPATLAFQIPSTDDCDEHAVSIREIMAGVLSDFTPKGCESEGMESFLFADTQMPIFNSEEAWQNADTLFGLLTVSSPDPEHIGLSIVLDTAKYELLTSRMREKFSQTVNLSTSKVELILNNDERRAIKFSVRDAFVNSEAAHGEHEYKLARRHKATIQLSNVAATHLARKGRAAGFTLREGAQ